MNFEWDEQKNQANIRKHGVSFDVAKRIFSSPVFSWLDKREHYDEDRFVSIGMVDGTVILAVVHTDREDCIRLISARPASKQERRKYHEQIQ